MLPIFGANNLKDDKAALNREYGEPVLKKEKLVGETSFELGYVVTRP